MTAPDMTPAEERDAWVAGMEALTAIYRANPVLVSTDMAGVQYPLLISLRGGEERVRAELAAWEALMPGATVTMRDTTGDAPVSDGTYWDLDGEIGGLRVRIRAYARWVAEQRVTGTEVIETREWIRKPVEPQDAAEGENRS